MSKWRDHLYSVELTGDDLVMLINDLQQLFKILDTSPPSVKDDKLKNIKRIHDILDDAYDKQVGHRSDIFPPKRWSNHE